MPRTHTGSNSTSKPEPGHGPLRKLLLPGLAVCSLVSLFALPQVSAQIRRQTPQAVAPPGSLPVIGLPDPIGGSGQPLPAGLHIVTERYDNSRRGVNNVETALTPAKVTLPQPANSAQSFGKLFTYTVDGTIYGQPLYVQNLPVTNRIGQVSTHNTVFVTTNNNSVYAFDADSNTVNNGGPLWRVNFNVPGLNGTPTSGNDVTTIFGLPQSDIQPLIGIVSTPVIDEATGTLYVVARTTEGPNFVHRLHAIDIRTGLERSDSPTLVGQYQDPFSGAITPTSVPGNGDGTDGNGNVVFDLLYQNQRPALTLVQPASGPATVYVTYGGFDNSPPYHGWIFGFNTANLVSSPPTVFCTTPNNVTANGFFPVPTGGGIDMSGSGPASDGSSLYVTTGLGAANNRAVGATEFVQSVLKIPLSLTPSASNPLSFFRPFNYVSLSTGGLDLGTGGLALFDTTIPGQPLPVIPGHPNAMITAGQEGKIYLLDRGTPGGISNQDAGAISTLPNLINPTPALLGPNYGAPTVFLDNTGLDPGRPSPRLRAFFHAAGDAARGFSISSAFPYLALDAQGTDTNGLINYDFPGAQTSVSANNGQTAIVWEIQPVPVPSPVGGGGNLNQERYALLRAYDASLNEIYNSNMRGGGINSIGDYIKYSQPTVANGKVYVPANAPTQFDPGGSTTFPQGRLVVFGLTNSQPGTTGQGTHYQLSGPVGWTAFSSDGPAFPVGPLGFTGTVEAGRAYSYSITALDSNNQPKAITGSLTLSLTDVGFGPGRQLPLGSVTFNNQSYVVFSKTINTQGFYIMKAADSNGNRSQYYPNIGDIPYVQVVGTSIAGFDRFNLRLPTSVRNGQLTNVTVTPVSFNGFPVLTQTFVTIYDTLPNGGQDFALPSDTNPLDGFGFPNFPPYELLTPNPPYPTFHSQAPLSTLNFAYELQYGIADFALTPGWPIGIYSDGGPAGSSYPNINNSGTYPCVFNGVGQHVVIVYDAFFGQMTTGVVNVTP